MKDRFSQSWHDLAVRCGYESKHEMLYDFYVVQGLSFNQIGERVGCSPHAVGRNLAREGIDRRSRGGANNIYQQTRRLWLFDQRVILNYPQELVSKHTDVSKSLVYKYRKLMEDNAWNSASSLQQSASNDTHV